MSRNAVGPLRFPEARDGDGSALFDLVALPLAHLFPGAAECPGHATCRIALRPARRFADGSPVTAAELARTIGTALGLPPGEGTWYSVGTDALTVRLSLDRMASVPYVPVLKPGTEVGTGPYRVVQASADRTVLEARDPARRPRRIEAERVSSLNAVLARFLSGRADVAVGMLGPSLRVLRATGRLGDVQLQTNVELVVSFNEAVPALKDPEARRCLGALISKGFQPWRARTGLLPPEEPVTFDAAAGCVERLRAALDRPLRLSAAELAEARLPAEALRLLFAEAGVPLTLTYVSPSRMLEPLQDADLRLGVINRAHPSAPGMYVASGRPWNVGRHHDAALDGVLARAGTWADIAERLAADPPFVPLGMLERAAVTSRAFRFVPPEALGARPFSLALALRPVPEGR